MSAWSAGSAASSSRRWPQHRRGMAPPATHSSWHGGPRTVAARGETVEPNETPTPRDPQEPAPRS
jgi:hypothetical protein